MPFPHFDRLSFAQELSRDILRASMNPAFNKLESEVEDLRGKYDQARERIVELQTHVTTLQQQLFKASKQLISSSPVIPAPSLPATGAGSPQTACVTLKKTDYPAVKYWKRPKKDKSAFTVLRVTSTSKSNNDNGHPTDVEHLEEPDGDDNDNSKPEKSDDSGSDSDSTDNDGDDDSDKAKNNDDDDDDDDSDDETNASKKHPIKKKSKDGVYAFLENADGSTWTPEDRDALYRDVRSYWTDTISPSKVFKNWTWVPAPVRVNYRAHIEALHPRLRLCSNNWKADKVWMLNYHSWKKSFLRQNSVEAVSGGSSDDAQEGEDSSVPGSVARGKKRKKHSEDNGEPGHKKAKATIKGKQVVNAVASSNKPATPSQAPSTHPLAGFSINTAKLSERASTSIVPIATSSLSAPSAPILPSSAAPALLTTPATTASASASSAIASLQTDAHKSALIKLQDFSAAVKKLPLSIPLAKKDDRWAQFNVKPASRLTAGTTDDADIWETWDPILNGLIPNAVDDILPYVTRGVNGLPALVGFFQHLVEDRKVDPLVLEGKISRVMTAMTRKCPASGQASTPPATTTQAPENTAISASEAAAPAKKKVKKSAKPDTNRPQPRWKIPAAITPKWEAAREWQAIPANTKKKQKEFDEYWELMEQNKKGDGYQRVLKLYQEAKEAATAARATTANGT
ncbi:hypothetical protein V5O48_016586, partial [Marasmius crinis-equi]